VNLEHSKSLRPANVNEPKPDRNAVDPELPDYVIIPRIPGLPPEVTGGALRAALQIRAETGVFIRRA
jgi:hypothetical protein